MTDTLILVSNSFPYAGVTEESFIAPEIGALAARFGKIIILPLSDEGIPSALPENVETDTCLCRRPSLLHKIASVFTPSALGMGFADFSKSFRTRDLAVSLSQSCYVSFFRNLLRKFIIRRGIDLDRTLFYTFWFDFPTAAIAGIPAARIVTRAHGYDIFEERGHISRSWRKFSMKRLSACFPASEFGAAYMRELYPLFADKIKARILGSTAPEGMNPVGEGEILSLYGCSRLSEEKGVLRQFEYLSRFAAENPSLKISYTHIGDGPLRERLRKIAETSPSNINFVLKGALPNAEVHKLLSSCHVDIAILLSHTEGGIPLALCEAISYGIPVLATAVGGVTGLPSSCGVFLNPECSYRQFADGISVLIKDMSTGRTCAREQWEKYFDNRRLRDSFADEISRL